MLTIDLFTTPKPFTGLTATHQANALRSWRGCPEVRRIFVFGAVSGETDSITETGAEVMLDVECTENGLPSIRSMFEIAAERSEADLLMFTNADMIYLRLSRGGGRPFSPRRFADGFRQRASFLLWLARGNFGV
jgi:hypothetical protein